MATVNIPELSWFLPNDKEFLDYLSEQRVGHEEYENIITPFLKSLSGIYAGASTVTGPQLRNRFGFARKNFVPLWEKRANGVRAFATGYYTVLQIPLQDERSLNIDLRKEDSLDALAKQGGIISLDEPYQKQTGELQLERHCANPNGPIQKRVVLNEIETDTRNYFAPDVLSLLRSRIAY